MIKTSPKQRISIRIEAHLQALLDEISGIEFAVGGRRHVLQILDSFEVLRHTSFFPHIK